MNADPQQTLQEDFNEAMDDMPVGWKLLRFNPRRASRGVEAAEVEIDSQRLWMSINDIKNNIAEFGDHPELQKALEHYRTRIEYPANPE